LRFAIIMFLHVPTLLDLPVLNRELHRVGRKPWLHVLRYGYAAILILQLIILLSASRITSGQASLPRLVGLEAPSILDIRRRSWRRGPRSGNDMCFCFSRSCFG